VDGASASAASTSARAVMDLEPGGETVAVTGPAATGAGHGTGAGTVAVVVGTRTL
jgi:hypothetical protein